MKKNCGNLTLEDLDGEVWREPEFRSHLVLTCHRLRKKRIHTFTTEDLRMMIGQGIGAEYLVPLAVKVLQEDPFAESDFYEGDLLDSVIGVKRDYFDSQKLIAEQSVAIASRAIDDPRYGDLPLRNQRRLVRFINGKTV